MIVKQRHTAISNQMLFGIGGGVALLLAVVSALKWGFQTSDIASCDVRYRHGVVFSLARKNGDFLATSDLLDRLAPNDWGVANNTRVVATGQTEHPVALEVVLKAGTESPGRDTDRDSGAGFRWESASLKRAVSVCLSYHVWLPKDFKYGTGGRLPGLSGGLPDSAGLTAPNNAQPFGIRVLWRPDGGFLVVPRSQRGERPHIEAIEPPKARFGQGSWTRIDQEAVLNNPGKADGIARVWINGKLQYTRLDIAWRGTTAQRWTSVVGDTHFQRGLTQWMPAPHDTNLRLSPFELRVE